MPLCTYPYTMHFVGFLTNKGTKVGWQYWRPSLVHQGIFQLDFFLCVGVHARNDASCYRCAN